MRTTQDIKINRYYGLRVMSSIYKLLALGVVLAVLGGAGYTTFNTLNNPALAGKTGEWLPPVLGYLLAGFVLALTFYLLSQMVDLLLSMNDKLRALVGGGQAAPESGESAEYKKVLDRLDKLTIMVDQQSRAARLQGQQPPIGGQTAGHKP